MLFGYFIMFALSRYFDNLAVAMGWIGASRAEALPGKHSLGKFYTAERAEYLLNKVFELLRRYLCPSVDGQFCLSALDVLTSNI